MGSDKYSITWNDHSRNVIGVCGRFLEEESFVDCTIVAEGEHLKAHRLMLSACSSYFELLFSQEMKREKVVVLEDIGFQELKSLIAFMYHGRVTVPKDRLQNFVRAAESLQIKGLPSGLVNQEATKLLEARGEEGLASHVPHRCVSSSVGVESSDLQCVHHQKSSIGRMQSRDERSSSCIQTDVPVENVRPQPQRLSDTNRGTAVFSAEDFFGSLEPKEEVDVEDTPVWESEDENTTTVTDLITSAAFSKESQDELTPVTCSISCSTPPILENETMSCITKFSLNTGTGTHSANTYPFLSNISIEQCGLALEDSSSCVQEELTEQSIWVKKEPILKSDMPVIFSSHNESTVEPMYEVWMDEMQFSEGEEVMIGTDSAVIHNQETTNQDVDVDPAPTTDNCHAVRPSLTIKPFTSSCVVAKGDRMEFNAQDVKIEGPEMNKPCIEQECKIIDINDSTVGKVVECGQQGTIEIVEDKVDREVLAVDDQKMVGMLKKALDRDTTVGKSEAEQEEVSALLSQHISKLLQKKSHKCPTCPDILNTVSGLKVRVQNLHEKERSNRCEVCAATSALVRHMRNPADERFFLCAVCQMTFSDKNALTIHKQNHTSKRPFQCNVCRMSFVKEKSLSAHKLKHKRSLQCDVCAMSFNHESHLIIHKRKHSGDRPFKCEVCEGSFSTGSELTVHKRKHTGERPFQCEVCAMSFIQASHLTVHKRKHTGERPYKCDVCTMYFIQASHLKIHKRKHTGERPFHCGVCKCSFSAKNNLMRHMRTHTSEQS